MQGRDHPGLGGHHRYSEPATQSLVTGKKGEGGRVGAGASAPGVPGALLS